MTRNNRRVAVIGAGPAGAITTDALVKEHAFNEIRVFERQSRAGGTWNYNPEAARQIPSLRALLERRADLPVDLPPKFPCNAPKVDKISSDQLRYSDTGAHKHLHSNLPPDVMAFTQEPIPVAVSKRTLEQYGPDAPFRHRELMREWVEAIFTRGQHDQLVEYDTTVELVEKVGTEWVLTLRKSIIGDANDFWWQESFDSVVVATGHYYLPYIPDIPGLTAYSERCPGKIIHSKHYPDPEEFRGKRVIVVGGSVSAFDALHDIRLMTEHPVISSLRKPNPTFGWAAFTHPDIVNKPQISVVDHETGRVTFADNSYVKNIDFIVFATGYEFSFPFLPGVEPVNGRVPGLYEHVFKIDDPSIAFIGMVTGGFGLRIFEWQAVAAARVLAGHANLPDSDEMKNWEQDRITKKGDSPAFWTLMPDFEEHFEALRAIAGEPLPGTQGRVLPRYDPKWADTFWELINYRIKWWKEQAAKAGTIS